jgi:signal transduction histidine kinase
MSVQTPDRSPHETPPDSRPERTAMENAQRATLNILEDFAAEKSDLERGQRATLNILEDFDAEKTSMAGAQRAALNILDDFVTEKSQLEAAQHSVLNILDDFSEEKAGMAGAQRAVLNILDDFVAEKSQLEAAHRSVLNILDDFSEEKRHLEGTQRAVLNILEDFEAEKNNVELANDQLKNEIRERKRAEEEIQRTNRELLAANKELEAFSYSVSHDLRAPLRSLDGFSQTLLEDYADKLDSTAQDHLQRVRRAAQRMAVLIDDMLNLSRVTRCELRRETLNLSAMAKSIAAELRETEPGRRVEFAIENDLTAVGDSQLLRTAMENLLRNSWKYTSGHPAARIEFSRSKQNGRNVFFVRDDGAGFDPRYADRLFGAFQHLHTVAEFPGTGVGLATVQRIIHRHGGEIWAEGAVEKGATFYFTL